MIVYLSLLPQVAILGWTFITPYLFLKRIPFRHYWLRATNTVEYEAMRFTWIRIVRKMLHMESWGEMETKTFVYETLRELMKHPYYEHVSPYNFYMPILLQDLRLAKEKDPIKTAISNLIITLLDPKWKSPEDQVKCVVQTFTVPVVNLMIFLIFSSATKMVAT